MACNECRAYGGSCPCCEPEPIYELCPNCNGDGWLYFVDESLVTKTIFDISPRHLAEKEPCDICGGTGEREVDPEEYDDSDDRYEQYRERQWENEYDTKMQ